MNKENMIIIKPLTRIRGEAKISIFLDEKSKIKNSYFQSTNLNGFESYVKGRRAEDVPRIATHINSGCSWAHHLAAVKAMDQLFGMPPPKPASMLRELSYHAHIIQSHLHHILFLASPDLLLPVEKEISNRSFLSLLQKYPESMKRGTRCKMDAEKILKILSETSIHPTFAVPGGVTKALDDEERRKIEEISQGILENLLDLFSFYRENLNKLGNLEGALKENTNPLKTYYMGMVDERNELNFYEGILRVVDKKGIEVSRFNAHEYNNYIKKTVKPWTYCKFAYLKNVELKEFNEDSLSVIFRVGSLSRINISEGISTPNAEETYKDLSKTLGTPCHDSLGYHWARLMEVIHSAERIIDLVKRPEIIKKDIKTYQGSYNGTGTGIIEAPQGTLIHQYDADDNGVIKNCTLVTPLEMNNAAICREVITTAKNLIKRGNPSKDTLNRIERGVRAYDPCP